MARDSRNRRIAAALDPVSCEVTARRYLLRYDPDQAPGRTGVALAIGNPDSARRTTVLVPGTGHDADDLPVDAGTGQRISDAMRSPSRSVVVWLDGPEPAKIVPSAAFDRYAEDAAPRLTRDLAGLRAAQRGAGPLLGRITVVGHSYGSVIAGYALRQGAHRYVDDAVFVGSPGVGVDHARDLGMDGRHVWSGQAGDDPILVARNRFTPGLDGNNPADSGFGARHFDVSGSHGHSEYFTGRSLRNIARIADGDDAAVQTVPAPDYRGARELMPDYTDAAVLDPVHGIRDVVGDLRHGHPDHLAVHIVVDGAREARHLVDAGEDVGSALDDVGSGTVHRVVGLFR